MLSASACHSDCPAAIPTSPTPTTRLQSLLSAEKLTSADKLRHGDQHPDQERSKARRCDHSICCNRAGTTFGQGQAADLPFSERDAKLWRLQQLRGDRQVLSFLKENWKEFAEGAPLWRKRRALRHSTDTADDTDRTAATSSGVRPKMKPQPFSAFARHHQGRTLSPRPYYQRGDQVGAADKVTPRTTPRPTRAAHPLAIPDLEQTRAPSRLSTSTCTEAQPTS